MPLILEDPNDFRSALAKGLGRTLLTLRSREPSRYADPILDACLTCERHDLWFEPDAAPYLMEHVRLAGLEELVLEAVIQAYAPERPRHIRYHLASILEQYAKKGEERAWNALFAAARQAEEASWSVLEELGKRGIEWLIRYVLPTLGPEEYHHVHGWSRRLPEDVPNELTLALRAIEMEYETHCERLREAREREPAFDPDAFLALPFAERPGAKGITFAGKADARQLYEAALQFVEAQEPSAFQSFFRIFVRRGFPLDPRLLVARADEEENGWAFRAAMSQIDSQIVHDYAVMLLRQRPLPWHAVCALERSFRSGDEPLLLDALRSVENTEDAVLHHHVKCLLDILEYAESIDWPPFYTWLYERSPCATCRGTLVRWAVEDGVLPDSLREELLYDVDPEIRKLVREGRISDEEDDEAG